MSRTWMLPCAMALLCLACRPAGAETVLFDFETDADLAVWHDEGKTALGGGKTLARAGQFASSGQFSLCFSTPQCRAGMPRWPAFEGKPPLADWSGYDRLVFDVVNTTAFEQNLGLFVTDSKVATRSGLSQHTILPPYSYTPVTLPLKFAANGVNPKEIIRMHFFTGDAPGDMVVYIDHIALLRPGEARPAPAAAFVQAVNALQVQQVERMRALVAEARGEARKRAAGVPAAAQWAALALAGVERRIQAFADAAAKGDALPESDLVVKLPGELARLESLAGFRAAFEAVRPAAAGKSKAGADLAVGFATSMEKVLPRANELQLRTAPRVDVSLARNEKESFQVVVVPFERDAKRVQVRAGSLRGPGGTTFSARYIDAVPVGYVQTKSVPPYGSPAVGWWPDPILEFQPSADIAKGDAQAFWVRVRAPKDQAPGTYAGKLEVLAGGGRAFSFDLSVRVFPFRLPDTTPLPLAITFSPEDNPLPDTKAQQEEWRKSPDYPVNAWKKHRQQWADFLADYYITIDSLYHHGSPDWEAIQRLHKQGRLGMFNLGYYGPVDDGQAALDQWEAATLPRLRANYDKAKELGVLDHAYIYGCDEAPADLFVRVQRAAEVFKKEFPGVLIMTTTYDHTFGQGSVIRAMDAFCPLTPSFDKAKAAAARAAGKQVWWYICCGPHHPHANQFIEYPAIEMRLLMGAMTARQRPDGFLYYQISIWNSQHPITSGPFTDWDPRSWTTYHGDGSWTCVGPDGTPLPTVRLENFRDGLEDYAYARILEATAAKVEAGPERAGKAEWLANARKLLAVPEDVMKSMTDYTRDPAALYRWRNAMGEAIATAGVPAAELKP